jgi:teichuronic acid exporter
MNMKKAALINAMGKYSKVILSIVVNAVLARLLSAEDYGIVAVITVFSTFFTTLSDMGFGAAIVQNKRLTKDDINNIFSFTVYISVGLMIIFVALLYPIAAFYNNRVYISLGLLLSISLLFNALNMVPNGILNREKKFASIAIRTVVVYIGSAGITIALAFLGFGYYALVTQAILAAFFTFIWNYFTTRPIFKLRFSKHSVLKVLNYSSYQFAFNIVNYFSRNLDNLLTGKFLGSAELGYYNKAYSLMLYPVDNLSGVVSPVLHPLFSDYQNQLKVIYIKYMKIVRLLACIGIYVAPVCFLGSSEIIIIMYGDNWEASVVCFKLLSIAIIPIMLNSSAGAVFQAIGHTRLLFINSCINTGVTILAILCGVFLGKSITILSAYVAVAYLFHFVTAFYMLIRMGFNYQLISFIKEISPEIIMLCGMIIGVFLYPLHIEATFASFIIKCGYLGVIYLVLLFITKEYRLFKVLLNR